MSRQRDQAARNSYLDQYGPMVVKQPWRYLPHTTAMHLSRGKWAPYLYLVFLSHLVASLVAKGNARIIVELPPRHGKSWFISQWLPVWFLGNWPEDNVILSTYEANFAASWGRKVRNLMMQNESEIGVEIAKDSAAAANWNTVAGGGMFTAGVGGPITGKGMMLGLIDDPHKNWKEANSMATCTAIQDWYDSTFYTRLEPGGSIIILHTRWTENDLIGYCLREHKDENWVVIRFPALAEEEDVLGRKMGEALCPERYNRQALLKIKNVLGSQMWNGLYQQRPSAMEGEIWLRSRWKYWRIAPMCSFIIQSWDTGFKKTEHAAYSVCQTWGVFPNGYALLDQWRDRVEYPELERMAKLQYARWKPNVVLIEDKASGTSLIQSLHRDTSIPVVAVDPTDDGNKVVRALAVTPMHEAGLLWLPEPTMEGYEWVGDMVERFVVFPNGVFKDEIDTASQALNHLREFSTISAMLTGAPRQTMGMLSHFRQELLGLGLKI